MWGTSPPKTVLPFRTRQILLSPTRLGLVNPTGLKFVKSQRLYSVADSGKRARTIGDAVGAAFAVLECAIKRGDELKQPLDSCP